MAFRCLFIGIDRCASPGVNWLSCAGRDTKDATPLFTDTFGGETTLLVDDHATVATVRERFEEVWACSADDVVVIAFAAVIVRPISKNGFCQVVIP